MVEARANRDAADVARHHKRTRRHRRPVLRVTLRLAFTLLGLAFCYALTQNADVVGRIFVNQVFQVGP